MFEIWEVFIYGEGYNLLVFRFCYRARFISDFSIYFVF